MPSPPSTTRRTSPDSTEPAPVPRRLHHENDDDASELRYDGSGPFGRAVRMNKDLMDGVAVFNRALSEKELKALSFCGP